MKYNEMGRIARARNLGTDLTPTFIDFNKVGGYVVGKYVSHNSVQSTLSEGSYNQYLFETDQGMIKFHLGAATDKEIAPLLKCGHIYLIEFQGKAQIERGRSVNKFKIRELDPTLFTDEYLEKPVDNEGEE